MEDVGRPQSLTLLVMLLVMNCDLTDYSMVDAPVNVVAQL